jgi:hypothetical protein
MTPNRLQCRAKLLPSQDWGCPEKFMNMADSSFAFKTYYAVCYLWAKSVQSPPGSWNEPPNPHRPRINFPSRWFRFSLRTWATAVLTWAEGEHTWVEGEHAWTEPEQSLSILSTPWVSLRTIMWNPFWPPVCPDYSFLAELCPGIRFCSLTRVPAGADFGTCDWKG